MRLRVAHQRQAAYVIGNLIEAQGLALPDASTIYTSKGYAPEVVWTAS